MSKSQQQVEYFRKTCSVCCAVYLSLQGAGTAHLLLKY
uniref:Uncharacterized protein n=1 Tax=Anguilla anguilla TaxID=7936 RepID=A0A0E9UN00_ANGAN